MRNFIPGIVSAIESDRVTYFFLLELGFNTPLYLSDNDFPVFHDGRRFLPRQFSFGDIAGSAKLAVESTDIEIDDTDKVLASMVLNEDVRNKWAILYFGVIAETEVSPDDTERIEATGADWAAGDIDNLIIDGNTLRTVLTQILATHGGKRIQTAEGKQFLVRY